MADTNYTYDISSDFPDHQVDSDGLTTQIDGSSISSATFLYIGTLGGVCDIWFDGPLSVADQMTLDGIVAAHTGSPEISPCRGGLVVVPIGEPATPAITPQGTPGSTTWGYKVTAFSSSGETMASVEGQTTTGASSLDETNFNRVSWSSVDGAAKYGVYRTTAGGAPSTIGKIAEVQQLVPGASIVFDDTGRPASGSDPSEDRSASVIIGEDPDGAGASKLLDLVETTTDDSTVTSLQSFTRKSSQTVQAGFGTGIYTQLQDEDGVIREASGLHTIWSDPASMALESDFSLKLREGGSGIVEKFLFTHDGRIVIEGNDVISEGICRQVLPVDGGVRGGTTSASTNNDIAAVRFDNGGDGWNRVNIDPPKRYVSGDLTFRLTCSIPSTAPPSTGTRWSLGWSLLSIGDALGSWQHSNTLTYNISGQTIDEMFAIDFTIQASQFDKDADLLCIKMSRIGTDPADDCGVHIYVHGLELRFNGFRFAGQ